MKSENGLGCVESYWTCGKNKGETEWNEERSETNFVVCVESFSLLFLVTILAEVFLQSVSNKVKLLFQEKNYLNIFGLLIFTNPVVHHWLMKMRKKGEVGT